MQVEGVEVQIRDTEREFRRFYAHAVKLKAHLGELTEERIDALETEHWMHKLKQQAALDGAIRPSARPDLDNFVKATLDGLNGILFADDSSIVQIWAAKMYGDVPRLVVEATVV